MNSPEWVAGARERVSQVMRLVAQVRAWAERTIFWRVWERMLENEFIDRGIALAAKAFVSFFPAIIVVAAARGGACPRGRISAGLLTRARPAHARWPPVHAPLAVRACPLAAGPRPCGPPGPRGHRRGAPEHPSRRARGRAPPTRRPG